MYQFVSPEDKGKEPSKKTRTKKEPKGNSARDWTQYIKKISVTHLDILPISRLHRGRSMPGNADKPGFYPPKTQFDRVTDPGANGVLWKLS